MRCRLGRRMVGVVLMGRRRCRLDDEDLWNGVSGRGFWLGAWDAFVLAGMAWVGLVSRMISITGWRFYY